MSMGMAVVVNRLAQFIIPLALVRLLDVSEFGHYRLFWLLAGTVMLFAPLGMPNSLLFFLPRSSTDKKLVFLYQTLLYLLFAGFLAALLVGPWSPLLPTRMHTIISDGFTVPAFVFLWVIASLVDVLPSADQRVRWQVKILLVLAVIRTCTILGTAVVTKDVSAVINAILIFAIIKVVVLIFYVNRHYGLHIPKISKHGLIEQLRYAVPFGMAGSMYNMRRQGEQWVVALLFQPAGFAIFSVAASMMPLVEVIRNPVQRVVVPKMSKAHAEMDISRLLTLNNNGNMAVSALLFPLLTFLFVFADQVVELLFTKAYIDAAPVLRIYVIGMARLGIEVASILMVFSQGRFLMKVAGPMILLSITGSYIGAKMYGLSGAALGSVVSLYIGAILNFYKATALTKIKLNKLQNWRGLAMLGGVSLISGLFAWWFSVLLSLSDILVLQLLANAAVFLFTYVSMLMLSGYGWILKAYIGKGEWRTDEKL